MSEIIILYYCEIYITRYYREQQKSDERKGNFGREMICYKKNPPTELYNNIIEYVKFICWGKNPSFIYCNLIMPISRAVNFYHSIL